MRWLLRAIVAVPMLEAIAASKAKIPMGRFVQVEEIAAMVAWVASPECSFTTGFVFDITGGRATY
jgi:3-oxoacyl-[acyl-carrier protein] reductase